jgi:hypothetical protein
LNIFVELMDAFAYGRVETPGPRLWADRPAQFDELILEHCPSMSDDRRPQGRAPVPRTRPATMLTAIGLCVLIMVMQLMPEVRDLGFNRFAATVTAGAQ